jgi:predicted glycosyltransferase
MRTRQRKPHQTAHDTMTHNDSAAPKIWIDLDNSPHVPFFVPIIEELEKHGCSVVVTARDCSNVCDLLNFFGVKSRIVGRHYGRRKLIKIVATLLRALQLLRVGMTERPDLAVSHGSRSQSLCCALLGIPTITLFDYEFANLSLSKVLGRLGKTWLMAPDIIFSGSLPNNARQLYYPGIKEDVYVPRFKPDSRIKAQLNLPDDKLIITVRPPATNAHYFNPESEEVFIATIDFLLARPNTKLVLVPRNKQQRLAGQIRWRQAFESKQMIVLDGPVDGLNLIWHSDLVISGGGTMNREAAALGVPVYSVYRGPLGAVDRYLASVRKRLTLIESIAEIEKKIILQRRSRGQEPGCINPEALGRIVRNILSVLSANIKRPVGDCNDSSYMQADAEY